MNLFPGMSGFGDIPDEIQTTRVCAPVADGKIRFGGGGFLSILDETGVQLAASSASETMGVTFFKFN